MGQSASTWSGDLPPMIVRFRRGSIVVVCLWLLFLSAIPSRAGSADLRITPNLSFRHVLPDQVEALGHINAIEVDAQGFLWFAGHSGLARYDGYSLQYYRHDKQDAHSLAANVVNALLLTRSGSLWVATDDGLNRYDAQLNRFDRFRIADSLMTSPSQNSVQALAEGPQGQLWLGTRGGLVRFNPKDGSFSAYPSGADRRALSIHRIAFDDSGTLWLATQGNGLGRFDPDSGNYKFYRHGSDGSISHNDVRSLLVDRQGNIWVGTYQGTLNRMDPREGVFEVFQHAPGVRRDVIWSIYQDRENRIWVGDGGGLNWLDPHTGRLQRSAHIGSDPASLGNHVVRVINEDRAGDLWLGFFPAGVDRLESEAAAFTNYRHDPTDDNSLSDGDVLSAVEDEHQNLWVGTAFGLSYFDRQQNRFQRFYHDPEDPNSLLGNTTLSLAFEDDNHLWVGSWSQGVNRMNLTTGDVERFVMDPGDPSTLLGVEPWSMMKDTAGNIWVATELGINRFNGASGDFTRFVPGADQTGGETRLYTRALVQDQRGTIWVGSDRGLFTLDPRRGTFTHFDGSADGSQTLTSDYVRAIYEDDQQRLWLGTHGGGVNVLDANRQQIDVYTSDHGLADDVVTGITQGPAGQLWVTTHGGVSRVNPDTGEIRNFDRRHGLMDNLFNRNTPFLTSWGKVFLGSVRGFSLLDPSKLQINTYVPPVVLTDFRVFNEPLAIGAEGSPLQSSISTVKGITLNHEQSVFSFEFAALNFRLPEENRYAYKLEGFDRGWLHVGNKRTATYTNLDAGEYWFRVIASNNDGIWNETGTAVRIRVLPAPWKTGWAYLVYSLLLIGMVVVAAQFFLKKIQLDHEKKVNARLLKLDKVKDAFLANTSHELRTPLNGMIGIAEALIDGSSGALSEEVIQRLGMISASGRRLTSLINDILDFAKLSERNLTLRCQPLDLGRVVKETLTLLRPLADAKTLALHNTLEKTSFWVMADENRLQQILINLLGNAIKYTNTGYVKISAHEQGGRCVVAVEDTGIGIRQGDIYRVFNAFEQLHGSDDRLYAGTGLGLAITKQLVAIHGGEISVRSEFGKGSTFIFDLAIVEDGAVSSRRRNNPELAVSSAPALYPEDSVPLQAKGGVGSGIVPDKVPCLIEHPETFRILIVDDDAVNRLVLKSTLDLHHYQVVQADSGPEALDILERENIDLVILDIMMPRMSGFDVCRQIRKERGIQELPVFFLTAKKLEDDLSQGFAVGANEFLAKPVNKFELLPQVANHLRLVQIHRQLQTAFIRST